MKLFTTAALIVTLATTAQAEQPSAMETCTGWGDPAERVMELRQGGVALSGVIEAMGEHMNSTQRAMIMDAYDTPRFRTPRIVSEVVQDFRNEAEHNCFSAFGEAA